jgi:hypothetical protein
VNRALGVTLLGLALVAVLFAVTWWTVPTRDCGDRAIPASLFDRGLTYGATPGSSACVHLEDLKTRIEVVYGAVAAIIILVGLAVVAVLFLMPRLSVPSETGSDVPLLTSLLVADIGTDREDGNHAHLAQSLQPEEGRRPDHDDVTALTQRRWLMFCAAAVVIVLVGLAFGAVRRSSSPA